MVEGAKISFNGPCPVQHSSPPNSLPCSEETMIKDAMQTLLNKQVIVQCKPEPIEFVSPIFTIPKKDGNIRLILNLKKLNDSVENYHFKMDNIHTALNWLQRIAGWHHLTLKMLIIVSQFTQTPKNS